MGAEQILQIIEANLHEVNFADKDDTHNFAVWVQELLLEYNNKNDEHWED